MGTIIVKKRLEKQKNSNGIRIFSYTFKFLILKTNDISLKEMFAKYNGENLTKEFTWDEPKGKEIW